jgi:hypothetical protein
VQVQGIGQARLECQEWASLMVQFPVRFLVQKQTRSGLRLAGAHRWSVPHVNLERVALQRGHMRARRGGCVIVTRIGNVEARRSLVDSRPARAFHQNSRRGNGWDATRSPIAFGRGPANTC